MRKAIVTALLFGLGASLVAAGAMPCVFARVTHLPCPACGSTRAVLALVRGDVAEALRLHPLAPIAASLLVAFAGQAIASVLAHGDFRGVGAGRFGRSLRVLAVGVVVLEVVLWGLRFTGRLGGPVPV